MLSLAPDLCIGYFTQSYVKVVETSLIDGMFQTWGGLDYYVLWWMIMYI